MQYYMIEWEHEEADDPWRLLLELDDRGSLRRTRTAGRTAHRAAHPSRAACPHTAGNRTAHRTAYAAGMEGLRMAGGRSHHAPTGRYR